MGNVSLGYCMGNLHERNKIICEGKCCPLNSVVPSGTGGTIKNHFDEIVVSFSSLVETSGTIRVEILAIE